jgi:hypothetical protein
LKHSGIAAEKTDNSEAPCYSSRQLVVLLAPLGPNKFVSLARAWAGRWMSRAYLTSRPKLTPKSFAIRGRLAKSSSSP